MNMCIYVYIHTQTNYRPLAACPRRAPGAPWAGLGRGGGDTADWNHDLLHRSPRLKRPCVRQAVLDQRVPLKSVHNQEGRMVLQTETPSARIARRRVVCLTSIGGQARKARIEKLSFFVV